MALGWTTGVGNVGDGVKVGWTEVDEEGVVSEREKGFTAIVRRDELYNRVVGCAPGRFVLL